MSEPKTSEPSALRSMGCMCLAAWGSTSMNVMVRDVSTGIHSFEIAFFRNLFGFAVLLPMLWRQGFQVLATQRFGLHLLRGVLNAIAMLSFFHAVTITPLATVAALAFTSPLFATLLAIFVLKERVGVRRITGLLIGFAGAMIIIRPGYLPLDLGAILVLLSSVAWGAALTVIKQLGRTETSLTTTAYAALILLPITALAAFTVWQTPGLSEFLKLFVIGTLGTITQLSIAQAFRDADISLVLPFDFTKLVWASLFGFLFFQEIPDLMTLLGGTIICCSVVYIAYREAKQT